MRINTYKIKQYLIWFVLIVSFQMQSCSVLNLNLLNDNDIIGNYQSTFKRSYTSSDPTSMTINLKNDNYCYITTYPNCTCPNLGFHGQWEIKGRHLHIENFPINKPVLIESNKTNDGIIEIEIIGEAPNCVAYSSGKFTDYSNTSGVFKIPENNIDSIQIEGFPFRYWIYKKDLKNNNFKIQFFENKNFFEYDYKLKIVTADSLIGKINNFNYCFIKKEKE